MKHNKNYFSHDGNAHEDPRIVKIQIKFGYEGVGLFWTMNEYLFNQGGYLESDIAMLGHMLRYDIAKLSDWYSYAIELGLYKEDGNRFYSDSLLRRIEMKNEKSNARSKAGKKGAKARRSQSDSKAIANAGQTHSKAIAVPMANDGNKKKRKETKEKEIKEKKEQTAELISSKKQITLDIDNLLDLLKQTSDTLTVAYDKNKERQFAKHILTAKEFGNFCEKIGQSRTEFACNVMRASAMISYWKGICSGPKSIYQNYADVFNKAKQSQGGNLVANGVMYD